MLNALHLPKLGNKSSLKGSGLSYKQNTVYRDNLGQNIGGKIYCWCEIVLYRKSSISIFQHFFASIDRIFNLGRRLSIRL